MKEYSKNFREFLEKRMVEKGLKHEDVASRLGFKNFVTLMWRAVPIENGRIIRSDLLSKLCKMLEVTELDLKRCEKEEAEKLAQYINSLPPLKPYISRHVGHCWGLKYAIPEYIPESGYIEYARMVSKVFNWKVELILRRGLSYEVYPDGKYSIKK